MKPSPPWSAVGLLWRLYSEQMWIAIGEPEVEEMRKTGVSNEVSALLPSLIGKYRDNGVLRAKADAAIGAADTPLRRGLTEVIKKLPDGTWYRLEAKGAVRVWHARGSFGNTPTLLPQQNLVIARVCRLTKDEVDDGLKDIRDYEKLVQELTPPKTAGQTHGTPRNRTVRGFSQSGKIRQLILEPPVACKPNRRIRMIRLSLPKILLVIRNPSQSFRRRPEPLQLRDIRRRHRLSFSVA
jgi:hypothetical protein